MKLRLHKGIYRYKYIHITFPVVTPLLKQASIYSLNYIHPGVPVLYPGGRTTPDPAQPL